MADKGAPPPLLPTNHSAWVFIPAVVFLTYSIIGVAVKIVSRMRLSAIRFYNWLIIVSAIFAFVETVYIIGACKNGLGQHIKALSTTNLDNFARVYP